MRSTGRVSWGLEQQQQLDGFLKANLLTHHYNGQLKTWRNARMSFSKSRWERSPLIPETFFRWEKADLSVSVGSDSADIRIYSIRITKARALPPATALAEVLNNYNLKETGAREAHPGSWGSDGKCCWFQPRSPGSILLPPAAGESWPRSWSLSTSCHGGWMRVRGSVCPHLKITLPFHSMSTSSCLFLVPLRSIDGSPPARCALDYIGSRSARKHAEMFLKVLLLLRLTKAPRLLRRKDIAISFSGVRLHGMCLGLLSCVYFLLESWWTPTEKERVSVPTQDGTLS